MLMSHPINYYCHKALYGSSSHNIQSKIQVVESAAVGFSSVPRLLTWNSSEAVLQACSLSFSAFLSLTNSLLYAPLEFRQNQLWSVECWYGNFTCTMFILHVAYFLFGACVVRFYFCKKDNIGLSALGVKFHV